jgi:hypothetical protein
MERQPLPSCSCVEDETAPLTEAQKAELDRRLALADTAARRPWSEVRAELLKGR